MQVFIHINKTGGTTITHILRSNYGLRHCQVEPWHAKWTGPPFSAEDFKRLQKLYPNLESIAGHRIFGHVDLVENNTGLSYFTMVRDPLRSCASRFQYKVQVSKKKNLVFEDWIQQDWTRNHQTKWIAGVDDVEKAIQIIHDKNIFVGITEHYDESMILYKALRKNDLDISYRRVNVAKDNTIKNNLLNNESTRNILEDAQQSDLKLYDYVKNELFPTYRKEYGPSLKADVEHFQKTRRNSFNDWNITSSRLKQFIIYKPLLHLNRMGIRII